MNCRAFNLIELLVAIAIVGILAALLLPVLRNAKNESAKAADLSNFHQMMAAIHLYTTDNRDSLTWPNWDYGRPMHNGTTPAGWLYQINPSASGPAVFNGQAGLLWSSLNGGKVLLCPMDNPGQEWKNHLSRRATFQLHNERGGHWISVRLSFKLTSR